MEMAQGMHVLCPCPRGLNDRDAGPALRESGEEVDDILFSLYALLDIIHMRRELYA
jgi:hypothetical protein